uniref:Purple acid phosphatase n=1 Tax=Angiostrongylus cantonensis TaxID=6313 RepID=A0A158P899_ANGCA
MRSEVLLLHNLFAVLVATWPEQVHLAFHGDYSVMAVLWTTFHYDYQIGGRQFSFKTLARNPQTYKVCIFGDLGYFHGNSTQSLIRNGLAGKFDFIVHLGDIAYDLHANNGTTGDKYMNQLEPLLSKIPYMVIAGNHEDDGKNFTDYQERFWMPDNDYHDNQFYSFDLGPIHWIGISTEFYGYYYKYGIEPVLTQYKWLSRDLTTLRASSEKKLKPPSKSQSFNFYLLLIIIPHSRVANANRAKSPWIVTFQHRPFYCSNTNSAECQSFENRLIRIGWLEMPGLEPLFLKYGVDMGFWGHEHSYERFYPIANKQFWNGESCRARALEVHREQHEGGIGRNKERTMSGIRATERNHRQLMDPKLRTHIFDSKCASTMPFEPPLTTSSQDAELIFSETNSSSESMETHMSSKAQDYGMGLVDVIKFKTDHHIARRLHKRETKENCIRDRTTSEGEPPKNTSRINDYGYSILTVMNSTHLHLEQISIEKNDLVVDDLWIVKDNHHVHSQELRSRKPGFKFPPMKCNRKSVVCRMSLMELNEEL